MLKNAWHLRIPTSEHYRWFKNLVDLHEITTEWLNEIQSDRPAHVLTRGLSQEVTENLWMLESLSEAEIEDLLDDTDPADMLLRLERTIWTVQAWTLTHLINRSSPADHNALESMLSQSCWRLGRSVAESRWQNLVQEGSQSLRNIVLALQDSPFANFPHGTPVLIRRGTKEEVLLELLACPHASPYPEVKAVADQLCQLQSHWIRGFGYALNNQVTLENSIHKPRCLHRWHRAQTHQL